ncbi:uncharacterized protein [Apostichopus japonicus]|uniref:uncharacterized protein isoform X2 n=1 Tax=Stichopus japonicus TaxID=307972 RepID=UPI003AB724BD
MVVRKSILEPSKERKLKVNKLTAYELKTFTAKMEEWSVKQSLREDILEAVETGHCRRVEELLDKGADVDESVGAYLSGNTLLTLAAEKGYEDIAKLLIDRGANFDVKVNNNTDIEQYASDNEMTALVSYIKRKRELNMDEKTTMNLLFLAMTEGHIGIAKVLIENNINLHYVVKWEDDIEDTAMTYAERMGQPEIVQLIKMKQDGGTINMEEKTDTEPATQPNGTSNPVNNEIVMDDVDAEKEFEREAQSQQIAPMTNGQRKRGVKSTSCIIT